ncbi:predicted protein [Sclerotinia sclerotiorum 1980 UF-70]|uniref:Uncharacterized protein n=1 Tax=Sclerotinia sclerotiorum (strain ATCC 18683 / 1980 / Ss-1) TaxID=665079 RepID=A7F4P0_SCLS1|nr:predicted protein [Sclerotinia sclerotiorum 1980 UF-70]EDN97711.1 predicted protein [Sclerotinia sclerotiorum 1980 UF-70]
MDAGMEMGYKRREGKGVIYEDEDNSEKSFLYAECREIVVVDRMWMCGMDGT